MNDKNKIIGFQGDKGAHSDLACRTYFQGYQTKAYRSFDEIFDAVANEEIDIAIIPFENSYAGRVAEIHNLLKETNLHITGEYFQDVAHYIAAPQGASLGDIKEVHSHPQALMQCRKFISKNKLNKTSCLNTATAAKQIAAKKDKSKAAICNKLAAEIYNLEIISDNIADSKDNKTIFISLEKEIPEIEKEKGQKSITTLLFTVRNIPAAIYKALGGFATNNVNIIKLESYISGGISQEAEFFISFEGDADDRKVQLALEELGFFSKRIRVLGVYNAATEREIRKHT
jgi:prephenate dehydratase